MHKVTDNLFVSSEQKARELGSEFDRVISMSSNIEHTTHSHLINDGEHEYDTFKSAVKSASEGISDNEEVLVHCRAGISRSVSVCIAAYVENYDVNYGAAYEECTRGFQYPDSNLIDSVKRYIRDETDNQVM